MLPLRAARLLVPVLAVAATLASGTPAAAASQCPPQTFLSFDHLAYVAKFVPAGVRLTPGVPAGAGTIDEPTSPDGCKRTRQSVQVVSADGVMPGVAVMVAGRPHTAFILGARCAGLTVGSFWDCLVHPLAFGGRRYTGTSYPAQPAPRGIVPLEAPLGTARLDGRKVTVLRIRGVDPSLAVGIRGSPTEAFLTPTACPYEGFENVPAEDDLLRCLQSPVWFTFDPPGGQVGDHVAARSDRPPSPEVAGATISLVRLSIVADLVPKIRSTAARVGRVGSQIDLELPDVPGGLYEAVVSCPRCASAHGGRTLFPAGSLLVARKAKTSTGIKIVSYVLSAAVVVAVIMTLRLWRRRRRSGGA